MSRFIGAIRQFGYVVEDIEAGMKYWSEVMGVGPWFYNEHVPIKKYTYKGQEHEVHNSVALANSGCIQVELIQTRNNAPSMYRDFIEKHGYGLQHVAIWTTQFDDHLAEMQKRGFNVQMSGEVGENGRFVYFDKEYHPGTVIELSEVLGPKGDMFTLIRESAQNWDGKDPIRSFPKL